MTRLLVVTAVAAEAAAISTDHAADDARDAVDVVVGGVGPVAAASATAALLAAAPTAYDLVICAGIGGGFEPLRVGDIAVASSIVFADLGAEAADGAPEHFETFGFAESRWDVEPRLAVELADRTGGHLGSVLTVATVTGTARRADAMLARHPDAVGEGMEGAGVAAAADRHGVAYAELRAISNAVGPRDRAAWRVPDALAALGAAFEALGAGWTS